MKNKPLWKVLEEAGLLEESQKFLRKELNERNKMKKIKIKKIELEVAGKNLSLSIEEAKNLRDTLLEAFPKNGNHYWPYYKDYPYWTWTSGADNLSNITYMDDSTGTTSSNPDVVTTTSGFAQTEN